MSKYDTIIIFGGARDYHAMDWYRAVRANVVDQNILLLTDTIDGEGFDNIIRPDDEIRRLFIVDRFLLKRQSRIAHIWRNVFKLMVLPLQVVLLRRFMKAFPNTIVHCHPMYYMLISWLAGVRFAGTPQGSEILVRAKGSKPYRYFASKALKAAQAVTVDSQSMADGIRSLSGVESRVVQNGIDIEAMNVGGRSAGRDVPVLSIRGLHPLYQIEEIIAARDQVGIETPLQFVYPFVNDDYLESVKAQIGGNDRLIGRLDKAKLYDLLGRTQLVVSIPLSDSSPRSVYEAIFAGCCVAVRENLWVEALPPCMRERVLIVDPDEKDWLVKAVAWSSQRSQVPFQPSEHALDLFDEKRSMKRLIEEIY